MTTKEKLKLLMSSHHKGNYENYFKSRFKINADFIHSNNNEECYREHMVSYLPMLPLLEDEVRMEEADYILYSHAFARCEDMSQVVLKELEYIDKRRKDGAEIIVVGKAANAEHLLNGSIKNITFWMSHFTEKLGKKFGIDICEQYFVWDDDKKHLSIWPVDGCLQKCKFCRRSYMEIPFESLSLETIQQNLDHIRDTYPERLKRVSLRAENLTEYGIDLYGEQCLHNVIDLIDSYDEVKEIRMPIGLSIGEITPEILDSLCKSKKIKSVSLNLETGTDRLLKLIGKKHTVADAIHVYGKLREANPNIIIDTTVMIGLPTEQMTDVIDLAKLIGQVQPNYIHCNPYVRADRQPLAALPQLSDSLKQYHLKIFLRELRYTVQRNTRIGHDFIPKNRYSRKYLRKLERVKKYNETHDFPAHLGTKSLIKCN